MKNGVLGTEKGGYNKRDVLMKIDAYMSLLKKIQKGISSADAKEALIDIKNMPLKLVPESEEGFAVTDVTGYCTQMDYNIVAYFKQP
jgi:hypothetical protein